MKKGVMYGAPFIFAFVLVTGLLVYLNSSYKNIFKLDFTPKSNSHLSGDSTKVDERDSLTATPQEKITKRQDSVKTELSLSTNLKDSIRSEAAKDKDSVRSAPIQKKDIIQTISDKSNNQVTKIETINPNPVNVNNINQTANYNKDQKDAEYADWLKNVTKIYEAMEPKKAAKIIQNYSDNVARDILYTMKKKIAAKVVAELNPEIANRIFRFE